ncbi:MAG: Uma2 family endonuclease [Lachnospiraceae bacterium]|nr:Uma2 family endonuclease [Lachnospiraceae bacterium]
MASSAIENQVYTVDDIYDLPDGVRAELIDGEVYYMAPPMREHQRIVGRLSRIIGNYIDAKQGRCEVYEAPFQVRLNKDDKNYVEPDISVICDPGKLTDYGCAGAPDWVIEVVSPGSVKMDYGIKLFKYRSAGVREYWLADPTTRNVIVYNFEKNDVTKFLFTDPIPSGIYPDLTIVIEPVVSQ